LTRPNPVRWVWYAVGGRLPVTYRRWVLHDATTRTWILRHAVRSSVLLVPLCSVWLLLPAPLTLRLPMVLLAALVGYFYSFAYIEESVEHKLAKHGYANGTGKQVRAAARAELDKEVFERYVARYRQQQ
jgi:hypothetical protein